VSRREVREALRGAAKQNLLERAIATVAPVMAARRQKARMFMAVAGGYTGASRSRRQTSEWKVNENSSADADILVDLPTLRDRARDLVRNEPLAAGALGGTVTSVVGTGLALQSRVDREALGMDEDQAAAWQRLVEREWCLWFDSTCCDATRTQNGYGLQSLVFRAALESGDVFVAMPMRPVRGMPYRLALQLIEADQVSNPAGKMDTDKLAGGVELDDWRAPIAYHVRRSHPGAINRVSMEWDRFEAFGQRTGRRQFLHVYKKLRPGQTRGVPWLAPVIETLKQLGRYTEAELMAAVVSGMFTVFVESERGGIDVNDPTGIGAEVGAGASDKDIKLGAGAIVDLSPGEKVNFANPGRPNTAFDGFVLSMCRFIGIALELPYEVLIKHFTASYSASRAALMEAWKFYRERRAWLAETFCQPVYEAWMDEAVATGRIAAPGYFDDPIMRRAYLRAEWVGDGPISLDPVKDVTAAEKRVQLGISTLQKETALHDGGDWEANHVQRVREEAARKRDGLSVPDPAPAAQPGNGSTGNNSSDAEDDDTRAAPVGDTETAAAMRESAAAMRQMAGALARQPAPKFEVNVAPPAVSVDARSTVQVPERSVEVRAGDVNVTVPEPSMSPAASTPPAVVVKAYPDRVEETIERDANNEITRITRTVID